MNSDDPFLTNKSIGALNRDTERRIADAGAAGKLFTVDLRFIPRHEWDKHLNLDASLPELVSRYLEGRTDPLSDDEVRMLEAEVARYHGVKPPYYITISPTLQAHVRPWAHIPEAGQYLTGFTFDKE